MLTWRIPFLNHDSLTWHPVWSEWIGNKFHLSICPIRFRANGLNVVCVYLSKCANGHNVVCSVCVSVLPKPVYVSIDVLCSHEGSLFQIRIALLMYVDCMNQSHVYDMITSRAMRIIWDIQCYSPTLTLGTTSGSLFLIIPSLWGEQGRIAFPSFSLPFSPSGLLE